MKPPMPSRYTPDVSRSSLAVCTGLDLRKPISIFKVYTQLENKQAIRLGRVLGIEFELNNIRPTNARRTSTACVNLLFGHFACLMMYAALRGQPRLVFRSSRFSLPIFSALRVFYGNDLSTLPELIFQPLSNLEFL